jgi:hypothetical protein
MYLYYTNRTITYSLIDATHNYSFDRKLRFGVVVRGPFSVI